MPKPRNMDGPNARKQAKIKATKRGEEEAKQKKANKSVANLNAYQTPHKDPAIQQQREQAARASGLRGHAKRDKNSKQNRGTTQDLNRINQ